jgi:hypothetical protein
MVFLFMLAMVGVSLLLFRLAQRSAPKRSSSPRKPGRPDGVRTTYKRGH